MEMNNITIERLNEVLKSIQGIEYVGLTPEMLTILGFEYQEHVLPYEDGYWLGQCFDLTKRYRLSTMTHDYDSMSVFDNLFQNIFQLQIFWFSVTGEEFVSEEKREEILSHLKSQQSE